MSNNAEVREVLVKARELISTPEKWAQHMFFTYDGRFCAVGAINQVAVPSYSVVSYCARELLFRQIMDDGDGYGLTVFNDTHTHEEVLALFDKVIAKLTPPPPPVLSPVVPDAVVPSWFDVPVELVDA